MNRRKLTGCMFLLAAAGWPAVAGAQDCVADNDDVAKTRAEQSILLLDRLVADENRAKQVADSGSADAMAALEEARQAATRVHEFLAVGCNQPAAAIVVEGINRASEAFRLARQQTSAGIDEYRMLAGRAESFLAALETQPPELRGVSDDDFIGMQRQLGRAREMATDSNYEGAVDLLKPVADRLERRLIAIFDQRTIVYEKNFATPADEFEYLAEQYRGYELLLDQVASQRPLPFSVQQSYDRARQAAAHLDQEARALAASGEWQDAIDTESGALEHCEQALRLIGIRY